MVSLKGLEGQIGLYGLNWVFGDTVRLEFWSEGVFQIEDEHEGLIYIKQMVLLERVAVNVKLQRRHPNLLEHKGFGAGIAYNPQT